MLIWWLEWKAEMDYDFKTRLASERQKVEEEFDYEGKYIV